MINLVKTIIGEKYVLNYLWDDWHIGQRMALGKYEPYLTKLIQRLVQDDDVVIDVGANIGYYSLLLAKKAKTVYAFEPEKTNFEILEKNISENKIEDVRAKRSAVGGKNSKIKLFKSEENMGDHRVFNPSKSPFDKGDLIQIVRLDDEIKDTVDLIKIDTQGWEPEVVAGAKKIIEKDKPTIIFEYWPWAYKKAGLDYKEMINFLRKIYGKIYYIDEYIRVYFPVDFDFLEKYYTGERSCNLMVNTETNFWDRIKDLDFKKLVKRKLGRVEG